MPDAAPISLPPHAALHPAAADGADFEGPAVPPSAAATPPKGRNGRGRPPVAASNDLSRDSIRGSVITTGGFVAQSILRLGGNLVVARLLAPEYFGIAALVNILLIGLQMLSDLGIKPAIVQRPNGEDEGFLRTAFTLQVGRGVVLAIAACLLAWPAAQLYDPRLLWLVPIASIGVLANGFASTNLHRLNRHLLLGRMTLLELGTQVAGLVGMVVWALVSPGVLALIIPTVLANVAQTVASHFILTDRYDRFGWDREMATDLINFSRWILISTILGFVTTQADRLILGRLVPMDLLGVYGIALMLAMIPRQLVLKLGSSVLFPALSKVSDEPGKFASAVNRSRTPLMTVSGYLISGLIASGPPLVLAMYDSRYYAASWILPALACGMWLEVLSGANGSILLSRGRTKVLALAQLTKGLSLVAFILIGDHLAGFPGTVVGVASAEIFAYLICFTAVTRLGVSLFACDAGLTLLLAATAAAGYAVGHFVPIWVEARGLHETGARLTGFAVAGVVVTLLWAWPLYRAIATLRRR